MVTKSAKRHIRNGVYHGLLKSGLLDFLLKGLALMRKDYGCIILTYHRFVDDRMVFLKKWPGMHHHIEDFEKEIIFLQKYFNIVSLDEAVNSMKAGHKFLRPSIVITFDDGYLDNYTLAYPVLKRYDVPATIYLTTGLIGTSERTWLDRIELALLNTDVKQFAHPELFSGIAIPISTKADKEKTWLDVGEALKLMPRDKRVQILEDLLELVTPHGKSELAERMMLNWEEVKEMAANGITFGSHSNTHPILSRMPVEQAKEEIYQSKTILEEHLGAKVKHFAFPNGGRGDFSEELRTYCRDIGFESVATLMPGTNNGSTSSAFSLRRIGAMSPFYLFAGTIMRIMWKSGSAKKMEDNCGYQPVI